LGSDDEIIMWTKEKEKIFSSIDIV
jgi:hypothetical protein